MARVFFMTLVAALLAGSPVKLDTASSQASQSQSPKKTSTHKAPAARKRSSSRSAHSRSRHRAPPAPSYQLHPDPERYTQIQQALADRGYYKGPVNGQWSDDSTDALKRFQTDQKLEGDGKLNAHTLTNLGLGPKHDGTTAATVPLSATATGAAEPEAPPLPIQLPPETSLENLPE